MDSLAFSRYIFTHFFVEVSCSFLIRVELFQSIYFFIYEKKTVKSIKHSSQLQFEQLKYISNRFHGGQSTTVYSFTVHYTGTHTLHSFVIISIGWNDKTILQQFFFSNFSHKPL